MLRPAHLSHQPASMLARAIRTGLAAGLALSAASAIGASPTLSLNGAWQFAHAATEKEARALEDFYQPGFDRKGFQSTPVPSNWALQGYEEPTYKKFAGNKAPEGFYVRTFKLPADWSDRRVLLHFGGVWASAEVWLNGKLLGRYDSGFTGFSFDATSAIKRGSDNVLAVRVRQATFDYEMDANDDWSLGGIYRDVTLEAMPKQRWLDNIGIQTVFDEQFRDADLKVRVMVADKRKPLIPANYVGPGEPYELRLALLDKDGKEVQQQDFKVPAHYGTSRETSAALRVQSPLQWTAETPNLYKLRVQMLENGKVVHEREEKVGFRQISTTGGVFRVNGQAVKLRGVNRHDEHPDVGRATTREHWLQDLKLMKEANVNFIRFAHYPPAKGFVELCDEMGMYVGNEVPFGYGGGEMHDPVHAAGSLLRSYATVARDINHPSVIYWSIGNEDPLTTLHMASVRAVKGWDPSRPVLLPWRSEHWLPPEIDIMAPHYWTAQENSDFAARSTRPVITTEFTHAYGDQGMGGLNERWRALIQHPAGAGGAIWMWADQGLKINKRKPDGTLAGDLKVTLDGWDGIVDSYRKPTRDYWEAKAVFAQVYPVPQRVSFLPGQASVNVPIQNEYDFINLRDVKIEWSIMEDDRRLSGGTASIAGEPHASAPFALPLAGLKAVKPGATYYAWFRFLRADGSEITRRTVELDYAGVRQPVPTSNAAVTVERAAGTVVVKAGKAAWTFDPRSGQLSGASVDGKAVLNGLKPALWRKLNPSETVQGKPEVLSKLPDLDRAAAAVSGWDVKEQDGTVNIAAKVDYTVDAANRYVVTYRYQVKGDGSLTVNYEASAAVQAEWLPFVGMKVTAASDLKRFRWLGLGPLDAAPNQNTAPILGVWSGEIGTPEVTGTKATRWAEFAAGSGAGFKVRHEGYVDTATGESNSVRVLSDVVGLGSKGRRPEGPASLLETGAGKSHVGEFAIQLLP